MRYSSASFNSHRIHYDRAYAVEREYYPGLLVHGPLSASLLINLYQKNNPKCTISAFQCRATAPLYDIFDFYIMGKKTASGADLWAVGPDGVKAMLVSVGSE
jgi:3-methylfumaryl-CoA hydratase